MTLKFMPSNSDQWGDDIVAKRSSKECIVGCLFAVQTQGLSVRCISASSIICPAFLHMFWQVNLVSWKSKNIWRFWFHNSWYHGYCGLPGTDSKTTKALASHTGPGRRWWANWISVLGVIGGAVETGVFPMDDISSWLLSNILWDFWNERNWS